MFLTYHTTEFFRALSCVIPAKAGIHYTWQRQIKGFYSLSPESFYLKCFQDDLH